MRFDKDFEHNESLFQAAIEEFSRAGYDQSSINVILETAGMSKGQFYYHFKNKQGLYFALIEVLIAQKQAFMASVMQPDDFAQDLFTVLKTQVRRGAAFARSHPEIEAFSESFLREKGNPIYAAVLARYNFDSDAGLHRLIEQAHRRGELRADLPLPFLQNIISHLFTHAGGLTDLTGPGDAEARLEALIDFIRSGAAATSHSSEE